MQKKNILSLILMPTIIAIIIVVIVVLRKINGGKLANVGKFKKYPLTQEAKQWVEVIKWDEQTPPEQLWYANNLAVSAKVNPKVEKTIYLTNENNAPATIIPIVALYLKNGKAKYFGEGAYIFKDDVQTVKYV